MKDPDLISNNNDVDATAQQIVKLKQSISLNEQIMFNNNVKILKLNNQVKELHTVLRDV